MSKELVNQAMANFRKLKASGNGKITLGDTIPKGVTPVVPKFSVDDADLELVHEYHDVANRKYDNVSDIIEIIDKDDKSKCMGFTYNSVKVYYHSGCMVKDDGVIEPHEISLYEL